MTDDELFQELSVAQDQLSFAQVKLEKVMEELACRVLKNEKN